MNPWWRRPSPEAASEEPRAPRRSSAGASSSKPRSRRPNRDKKPEAPAASSDGSEQVADFLGSPDYLEGPDAEAPAGRLTESRQSQDRSRAERDGSAASKATASEHSPKQPSDDPPSRRSRGGRRRRGRRRGSSSQPAVATVVLCDAASFARSLEESGLEPASGTELLGRLAGLDESSICRAYFSGREHGEVAQALERADFELIDGGDGLPIQMAVDALDLLTDGVKQRFLVISRDASLLPLVRRLKDREVGVAVLGATGELAESADRVFSLQEESDVDTAARAEPPAAQKQARETVEKPDPSRASSTARTPRSDPEPDRDRQSKTRESRPEAAAGEDSTPEDTDGLLLAAIHDLSTKNNQLVWASLVLQRIQELDSGFNERRAGFESFDEVVEDAHARGLLTCERHPESETYLITGYRSPVG